MIQMMIPSKIPELLMVQGKETIPEPIIVFQHVKIVVIDFYLAPGSLLVRGFGRM